MDILTLKAVISKSFFFLSGDQTTTPSPVPSPPSFTATRWSYLQSVPFVLNTNPQYPLSSTYPHRFQTLYLWKGGISNVPCRRSSCHCDHAILSEVQQREGSFFSLFFPLTGGSVHFCVLTPPLLWVFEFRSRRGGCSFCLLIDGGSLSAPPPFNHLIRLLCNPQGPSWARQQSHGTAGHCRQTPWPKPPITYTKNHKRSGLVHHYLGW